MAATMRKLIFIITLLFASMSVKSQDFLPEKPMGMVNDYAGMMSKTEVNKLEAKLRAYRDTTTNVLAVAIIDDLQGYSRDEVASTLFSNWRMWEGERYNGVLILIAKNDRELRIEVGYGLEGAIPDVMANRIVQDILIPNMRDNTVYEGLDKATDIMIELAEGEFEGSPYLKNNESDVPIDLIIAFFILFAAIIVILATKGGGNGGNGGNKKSSNALFWAMMFGNSSGRSRSGTYGNGGFGSSSGGFGGFSGGGGFGSGGGGAGGSW